MLFLPVLGFIALSICKNKADKEFLSILSYLILQIQGGSSFREALLKSISTIKSDFLKRKLQFTYDFVVFSQHSNKALFEVQELQKEFQKVDQFPHQTLQRLQNLRSKWLIYSEFRHKSGQVLYQVRLQSLLLTGIYLALLFYVIGETGFKHYQMILISIALFLMGLLLIFVTGRKIKWRV